jgi:proteasome accessory factor A
VEDDVLPRDFVFAAPVAALRQVSHDLTVSAALELTDGSTITALDVQWELLDRSRKYVDANGTDKTGGDVSLDVLDRWEAVLTQLEVDPMELADQLDWVAKYRMFSGYRERHGIDWDDTRIRALDLQYHDLRPEKSLAGRLGLRRLTTDEEVASAMTEPPRTTRAYFRGRCLQKWPSAIVAANWDSLVFDVGGDPLRRVPMMEPLRGTAAHVDALLEQCATPAELLERLGA